MATWDIFHSDRLEVERNLTPAQIRDGLDSGAIQEDDLARPAGSGEPWTRLTDLPGLADALAGGGPTAQDDELVEVMDEFLEEEDDPNPLPEQKFNLTPQGRSDRGPGNVPLSDGTNKATTEDLDPAFPDSYDRDLDLDLRDPEHKVLLPMDEEYDPEAEDEEAADFTLSRKGAETVEELDLAAMVDVAFQLVLFFLVTASTVIFKTLEVPTPRPEQKAAAGQGTSAKMTMDDLANDNILVDIDDNGVVKVDRETAPSDFNGLVARLRELKKTTQRTGMLLTANAGTKHKFAVMAYDAANECSLQIRLASPKTSPPPGTPAAAAPKAK